MACLALDHLRAAVGIGDRGSDVASAGLLRLDACGLIDQSGDDTVDVGDRVLRGNFADSAYQAAPAPGPDVPKL